MSEQHVVTWATCADELEIQAYERGYRAGHSDGRRRAEDAARAWQAFRDWLDGVALEWQIHADQEFAEGENVGFGRGMEAGMLMIQGRCVAWQMVINFLNGTPEQWQAQIEASYLDKQPGDSAMTDQTESASEYAGLLVDIECYELDGDRSVLRAAIAAIRALEAKAAAWERDALRYAQNADFWSADRDRLAGEVDKERSEHHQTRTLYERLLATHTDTLNTCARLTAELAAARENEARWQRAVADAYGWLWCVNEEPGTPNRFPAERAAYNARKLLRELLTHEQRGIGINRAVIQRDAARRAGGSDD